MEVHSAVELLHAYTTDVAILIGGAELRMNMKKPGLKKLQSSWSFHWKVIHNWKEAYYIFHFHFNLEDYFGKEWIFNL